MDDLFVWNKEATTGSLDFAINIGTDCSIARKMAQLSFEATDSEALEKAVVMARKNGDAVANLALCESAQYAYQSKKDDTPWKVDQKSVVTPAGTAQFLWREVRPDLSVSEDLIPT